jgi:3-oxoacyl-(acyl-carrier-protein) synthase
MEAFINGTGLISPQMTYDNSTFLDEIHEHNTPVMKCLDPNYKEYIKPIQLRRMSRSLRMGVTAAGICLRDAFVEIPDAIITGTGLGMMEETEKFLTAILDNDEKFLTPTSFIQSTHNTVGAHIAVNLRCNKYNHTYVHDIISFESALLDSLMKIVEHPGDSILLGGIDEITEKHYKITANSGFWRKEPVSNLEILNNKAPGAIPGEGAGFFLLSNKRGKNDYAKFTGVQTIYIPENLEEEIMSFLSGKNLTVNDIDLVLLGLNGDERYDNVYSALQNGIFHNIHQGYYKHLCGEFSTASVFASWLAAKFLKHQYVPEGILLNKENAGSINLKNILIYNQYHNVNHSLILLSAC